MSSSFKSTNKGRSNFENGFYYYIYRIIFLSSSRLTNKRRKLRFKDQISRTVMFRKTPIPCYSNVVRMIFLKQEREEI